MTGTSRQPRPKTEHQGEWSKAGACAAVLCWTVLLLAISSGHSQPPAPPEPAYSAEAPGALAPLDSIPSVENALSAAAPQRPLAAPDPVSSIPASEVVRTSGSAAPAQAPAEAARQPAVGLEPSPPDDPGEMPPVESPDAGELKGQPNATPRALSSVSPGTVSPDTASPDTASPDTASPDTASPDRE